MRRPRHRRAGGPPGALGPVTSVYCEDPDGNLVEIASYQG
jgi:catechol 2,3-dioxygenase-like lactoylglutathione lyase family enzyme